MILSNECYLCDTCMKFKRGDCPKESSYCKKLFRVDTLYDETLLTDEQRKRHVLKPESVDTKVYKSTLQVLEQSIDSFVKEGHNLFLYSSTTGNGKTTWAIRLMQSYINKIWAYSDLTCRCLFINVPKFFMMLKDNISEKNEYIAHIKQYVNDVDLVVWDDIGTKTGTQYEIENLLSIINYRLDNGKSNIYTANLLPTQLEAALGARLASRINGADCQAELRGHDRRVVKG